MTKGLIILLKPLLQHEIRDAQFMKINLIPYIGHLVRNCINECKSNKQKTAY
jgi:hypothetical protein